MWGKQFRIVYLPVKRGKGQQCFRGEIRKKSGGDPQRVNAKTPPVIANHKPIGVRGTICKRGQMKKGEVKGRDQNHSKKYTFESLF